MFNTKSSRGKYLRAALFGAAAVGLIVVLTTRAAPKIKSEMMAKCKRMMAAMEQVPQPAACHSCGGTD